MFFFHESVFFHELVSHKPLGIPGSFQIFSKIRGDNRSSRFATSVVDTGDKCKKTLNLKSFNYLVWTPLRSRVNLYIQFCLQVHFNVSAAWYCSNYLPQVSTTIAKLVAKFAAGVVDTGGTVSLNLFIDYLQNPVWAKQMSVPGKEKFLECFSFFFQKLHVQ